MSRRGVWLVAGVLSLGWPLFAQPTTRSDRLVLNDLSPHVASLELSNAQYFFFATGLNWVEPAPGFLPSVLPVPESTRTIAQSDTSKDAPKEDVDLSEKKLVDYVHGEVGFLYGRSTGKFDRELEQGWVVGTAGNDRFSITAGATFQNWSGSGRGLKFRP